jgi:hypothetical protein
LASPTYWHTDKGGNDVKKTWLLSTLVCAALAGCATREYDRARNEFHSLAGQPVEAAISAWGTPGSERTIAGHHAYTWSNSVGGDGTTLQCKVNVETDADNTITSVVSFGNFGACDWYAQRVKSASAAPIK